MRHDYGYIKRTEGKDGDHVDVFIGPDPKLELVYVVNQQDPETKAFDEHKCLLGFRSESEARRGYLANYQRGWKGLGSIYPLTIEQFRWWLSEGDTTKELKDGLFGKKSSVRNCPGCGNRFRKDEPYPDVDQCEVCERFGTPKKADSARRKSVAVDLDGTLAEEEETFDPAVIGKPRPGAKKWMDAFESTGARVIVHTCRGDEEVVADWLEEHDIPYDHINENPDQPPDTSDKLFADVYWDNRAIDASGPLDSSAPKVLERLTRTKTSLAELHDFISGNEKSAQQPYYQEALQNQMTYPTWNMDQSWLRNIVANVGQARDRARRRIDEEDQLNDLRSALEPGFALDRFRNYMRSGDHVQDPVDQAMFRGGVFF